MHIIYQAFHTPVPRSSSVTTLLITSAHLGHIHNRTLSVSAVFLSQCMKQVDGKHNQELPFDHLFIIRSAGFQFPLIEVKKCS